MVDFIIGAGQCFYLNETASDCADGVAPANVDPADSAGRAGCGDPGVDRDDGADSATGTGSGVNP